jgi:hypothetical protein
VVRAFARLDQKKRSRVCPDDVGTVVADWDELKVFARIFAIFSSVAGPSLKISKCCFVPTSKACTQSEIQSFLEWIAATIPEWAEFRVQGAGEYLGFFLGPEASKRQFSKLGAKMNERVALISKAATSQYISALAYNVYVVSCTGYLAQLTVLDDSILQQEHRWISNILKIPYKALGVALPFHLDQCGGLPVISLKAFNLATLARAAYQTLHPWFHWVQKLGGALNDFQDAHALLGSLVDRSWSLDFWDSSPCVCALLLVSGPSAWAPFCPSFSPSTFFLPLPSPLRRCCHHW